MLVYAIVLWVLNELTAPSWCYILLVIAAFFKVVDWWKNL